MMPQLVQRLQGLLHQAHLNIVVPVLVAAGLLSYVASLASTPQAARELVVIAQHVWWLVLVLIFPYLAARLYVWHDFLRLLNLKVPFRRLLLAFAAGEMTKSLPAGIYVENHLLRRLAHQGAPKPRKQDRKGQHWCTKERQEGAQDRRSLFWHGPCP